jgi:uncharacterized protein
VTSLYNIVMLAVDIAAICLLRRSRARIVWLTVMAGAGCIAMLLGGLLGGLFENHFGAMRLCAYGLFLHAPLVLAATAVFWRRLRPWPACEAALAAIGLMTVAADAFLIEPTWLEVSHWRIASPKIHRPMRIVVLADLQTDRLGLYERDVLRQVLDEKPDLILFAGDYFQVPWEHHEKFRREFNAILREMHFAAPLGVFAVQGNIDLVAGWGDMLDGIGTAVGERRCFDLGDIELTCLPLRDSFNPSLVLGNESPDRFQLVLGHAPDYAMGKIDADLLVAGHTHGGQIRLPFIGAIITKCRSPRSRVAGLTELPGGNKLLVTRGVGMERGYAPRLRFFCRPELMVIDLVPENSK